MSVQKLGIGRWRVRVKHKGAVVADRVFPRQKDAQDWEAQQKRALSLGEFVDPKAGSVPLGDVMARWIESREHAVSGKTLETERYALPRHVPSTLMHRPVSSIRTAELDTLWADLLKTLAPATVTRFRGMLSSVFTYAIAQRLVAKNPVTDSRVPRGRATAERDEIYPFSLQELHEVADAAEAAHPTLGPIVRVLGLTGLRWGELVALRVRDAQELPFPAFRVSRSASDNQPVRNVTKGGKARTVPLADEVLAVVKPLLADRDPDAFLFTTPKGNRLNGPNWKRAIKWSELSRGRREHDLRHTAATIWLSQGLDLKTVQTWLGHHSATLTADTYAHWMGTDADAAALARINAALAGTPRGHAREA